jgi:D-alanine-D-alanine ligase
MMNKIKIGVLFGGRSAEHEVSLVSAASIINALDKSKYDVLPIGISKEGRWLSAVNALQLLKDHSGLENFPEHVLLPDPRKQSLVNVSGAFPQNAEKVDVIFPVIHGTFGEDGTIQGLFELADIPYVGAGVLGSAVGMDKVIAKQLLEQAGIPVAKGIWFLYSDFVKRPKHYLLDVEKKIKYPCFVIVPSNEFYDYDAKYVDGKSKAEIPAKLSPQLIKKLQACALKAYSVLDCSGMARVDFLVQKNGKIFLNEINTIPGFTSISMYPKLWEASGVSYTELLDRLIEYALERYRDKKKLKTFYTPKTDWYKE